MTGRSLLFAVLGVVAAVLLPRLWGVGALLAGIGLFEAAKDLRWRLYQRHLPLQLLKLPLDVPSIQVVQVWHERTHAAPLHRWFRRQLQQTLRDGG